MAENPPGATWSLQAAFQVSGVAVLSWCLLMSFQCDCLTLGVHFFLPYFLLFRFFIVKNVTTFVFAPLLQ